MTRARILADYVSGGTTAAEFDYLDGVTSNVQTQMDLKAPLASPAITGTPSVTLGSDATGDVYYRAADGALTRLPPTADSHVLTSTGVGAVPNWEALPSFSSLGGGEYAFGVWDRYRYDGQTTETGSEVQDVHLAGDTNSAATTCTLTTTSNTSDLLTFEMDFGVCYHPGTNYLGFALKQATAVDMTTNASFPWKSGQHSFGSGGAGNGYYYVNIVKTNTIAGWGLAASTTYFFQLRGMTHGGTGSSRQWGVLTTNETNGDGVCLSTFLWNQA